MGVILPDSHIGESLLEQYVMGELKDPAAEHVASHLSGCTECFDRYEFELLFQSAVTEMPGDLRNSRRRYGKKSWWHLPTQRLSALGVAAALLIIVPAFLPRLASDAIPVTAELTATRGTNSVHLKSGQPLRLLLSAEGTGEQDIVRVQVVLTSGARVWEGTSISTGGFWPASVHQPLARGNYYVKVLRPSGDEIREFPLIIE